MDEPVEPRRGRGEALNEILREDLELQGVAELQDRIALLETEIARTRLHLETKQAGRAAADALFGGLRDD
ncbi:DUF1192 domain-containing protein [Caulobacter segnis]|uniref:DUF1192 domain-containing protein n=1 Tax=Caulobacter segnis TaxID=88688 RepID=UPI00241025F2|nr:DUF1192 domain-containing protein [Caulobacter segnis]MDG2520950.1 DUF1192 domain-containing protein [Caulobacter segnis]